MRDNIDRYDIYSCESCEKDIGFIFYENALCVGYPRLPGMEPFFCGNVVDESTSISNRLYFGCQFGSGLQKYVLDCLIGVTCIKDQVFMLRIDE